MVKIIKEVIVVEGRDDITAVKAALDAEVIATGGFGYKKKLIEDLRQIAKRSGIIILTDPDYAGKEIRRDLAKKIPGAKHAFLPQGKALKKGDIGVENASPEDIRQAINKARPEKMTSLGDFKKEELVGLGLVGGPSSKEKRDRLTDLLGIGHCNGKQLVNRLNSFGVSREEFNRALERMDQNG